jgi:hypothetical protein
VRAVNWFGRARVEGSGGLIALDGGAVVPPKARMTFDGIKGTPDVVMSFEVRDSRPECTSVIVTAKPNGRGIRTADMQMFNIDNLAIGVFGQLATTGVRDQQYAEQAVRSVHEARLSRRGALTRDELEEVAKVYREHLDASPTKAVKLLLGYSSDRTAARRVKQAEDAGLLPKTTQGKRRA